MGDLKKIPGVGENMERHLQNIGIQCVADLVGKDPEELYHLDRCAVYYAEHEQRDPEKLKWWYWKDKAYPEQEVE